ncbi:hypothetical protein TWF694_009136 [Orbilia ellipsospora]|uniref:Uncharacterized protein n=1 Tax=Orbilia ellipsospora TaxID=2528407 RepID=A0AAV9XE25_9PEZI
MKISQILSVMFLVAAASAIPAVPVAPTVPKGPGKPLPTLPPVTGEQIKAKAMGNVAKLPPAKATFIKGLDQAVWNKLATLFNDARTQVTKGQPAAAAQKKAETAWKSIANGELPADFKNLQPSKPGAGEQKAGTTPQRPGTDQHKAGTTPQQPAGTNPQKPTTGTTGATGQQKAGTH